MEYAIAFLKIRRRQFFKLLKVYRNDPDRFSLEYKRVTPPRKINAKSEAKIIHELKKDTKMIEDKSNSVQKNRRCLSQNLFQ